MQCYRWKEEGSRLIDESTIKIRSVEEYIHRFQDLYMMITNMEDSEAIHKFIYGLRPHIKV